MMAASAQFSVSPRPVWSDLSPVPLVVKVLTVAGKEDQLAGVRVDGETLVMFTVLHLFIVLVIGPGPRHLAHLTPGNGHLVGSVRLDTPLSITELTLRIEEHQLVASTSVAPTDSDS